ncbi:3'-5' exonuclease [bacterium]|nr:3'-5' exonuclease [bacterium]
MSDVTYLVFDVESVADGQLISKVRYPHLEFTPEQAIETYQDELMENKGTTFIPHTFQIPTAVVIAKVNRDFELVDIVSLDEPHFRPHVITENFWRGWEMYQQPQWVTFNGRSFDLPLMELAAFRFGISVPEWFKNSGYQSPRNRFNVKSHLDLQDLLTNFGAARCNGGLNLIAQMLGKPGKMGLSGDQVQQQFNEGKTTAISDYCRCDVLDTYFIFLRAQVLLGTLSLDQEHDIIQKAKTWIENRADDSLAYRDYLGSWRDWANP